MTAKTSMEITMSEDLKVRLIAVAPRAGKTVQEFAQEALYTFVDNYEDGLEAQEVLARNEPTISQEELEAEFALEDQNHQERRKTA